MLFDVRTVGVYLEVNLGQRSFEYNIALNYYMWYRFYLGKLLILVAAKVKMADYAYLLLSQR